MPRIKLVERGGPKLTDLLSKSDPWKQQHCGREKCLPCTDATRPEDLGNCSVEGVLYSIRCLICEAIEIKAIYYGESGRSGQQRGAEHSQSMEEEDQDHPLVKHLQEEHFEGTISNSCMRIEDT